MSKNKIISLFLSGGILGVFFWWGFSYHTPPDSSLAVIVYRTYLSDNVIYIKFSHDIKTHFTLKNGDKRVKLNLLLPDEYDFYEIKLNKSHQLSIQTDRPFINWQKIITLDRTGLEFTIKTNILIDNVIIYSYKQSSLYSQLIF